MQISELSTQTKVPIGTIKYYLREGLLHPGKTTGPRRAEYDDSHSERLRLLRALRDVADLPIERIRAVVQSLEAQDPAQDVVAAAMPTDPKGEPNTAAIALGRMILRSGKWQVPQDAPVVNTLVGLLDLATGPQISAGVPRTVINDCIKAADLIAATEAATTQGDPADVAVYRHVVVGELLLALRNVALQHHLNHCVTVPEPATESATVDVTSADLTDPTYPNH